MNLWSISFSYRLGLGFHALNNEGADGSNLMQPRRIDVGAVTYDGISGEIIRRQILENFVNICHEESIGTLPLSAGLHPDRGPIGIRAAAKQLDHARLDTSNLYQSVRKAIASCAVLDVGGYLAAWKEQDAGGPRKDYAAERAYIDAACAEYGNAEPVKRESCFDVGWLISEEPQTLTITQHSAFRDTFGMNSRYAQTMRSNVYAGVIRADLHRIGTDDYWYLQGNSEHRQNRLAIGSDEQRRRQKALVRAIANFVASPSAAKVAAWAPHVFLIAGAVLLTSARTAPFVSPIEVKLAEPTKPIRANPNYIEAMKSLSDGNETWVKPFADAKQLLNATDEIIGNLSHGTEGAATA